MTETAQIKCINKNDRMNPHERIINVGGFTDKNWKISQQAAIDYIKSGQWKFWVSANGKSVWVIVASKNGREYLKTENDGEEPNNLLSLPECP